MKPFDERLDLIEIIDCAGRDWDNYLDECYETEADPVWSYEDFVADTVLSAGYHKAKKNGEWIDKPTGAYRRMQSWCSACGEHSGIGGIESNRHKPFCPNCGAKMDGNRRVNNG